MAGVARAMHCAKKDFTCQKNDMWLLEVALGQRSRIPVLFFSSLIVASTRFLSSPIFVRSFMLTMVFGESRTGRLDMPFTCHMETTPLMVLGCLRLNRLPANATEMKLVFSGNLAVR